METGLSHELERLLQIVLELSQDGIEPKELFRNGAGHYLWTVSIFGAIY
jgi:hypothetical protein